MKRTIFPAVLLIGLGIIIGIFLISNITPNSIQSIFAKEKIDIGAQTAPIELGNSAKLINDALTKASDAVLPTVVYIDVEVEISSQNSERNEFFRFFGIPESDRRQRGSGSGVILTSDGYIVTNNHVIENAVEGGIQVTTVDKKKFEATLVGADPLTDIAVLKIEAEGLQAAHIGKMENINIGEMVLAVGNPLGLNYTVTSGIISAISRGTFGRRMSSYSVENYIQTDAAINPGNSGGGLYNLEGTLIGINTAIATQTGSYIGYGFSIPIDLVEAVVLDLIEDGKIDRGYIGVSILSIDETYAKSLGLDEIKGVLVQSVLDGSPAQKAGLEPEDVILKVDDKETNTSSELQSIVATYLAGEKVTLTIWRNGKEIKKDLTLKARDDAEDFASAGEAEEKPEKDENEPVMFEDLGFEVAPIPDPVKEQYNLSKGAFITKVERFSEAADRGLFQRGVIFKADRKNIDSPAELKRIIESKDKGDVILMQVRYEDQNQIVALEIK